MVSKQDLIELSDKFINSVNSAGRYYLNDSITGFVKELCEKYYGTSTPNRMFTGQPTCY